MSKETSGPVNLRAISVVRGGSKVELSFVDWHGRAHRKTYDSPGFLNILSHIANRKHPQRLLGLELMGATKHKLTPVREAYELTMDDGFVGKLGDLTGSQGGDDLLLALHEDSPRPAAIRQAIGEGKNLKLDLKN